MGNKLSYSSIDTWLSCGRKYKYAYVDRLRPKITGSALVFGTAFDKAIEAILKFKDVEDREVFDSRWTNIRLNNKLVNGPSTLLIKYSANDLDLDILDDQDKQLLKVKGGFESEQLLYKALNGLKKGKRDWERQKDQHKLWNLACWLSLRRKGHLMLRAFREEVLPRIKQVKEVQKKIELNSGEDSLVGYADLVAELENGEEVVLDIKTSSVEYLKDSVINSPQLTIYCNSLGISKAGYIVFNKAIKKERTCETCGNRSSDGRIVSCNNITNGSRCNGNMGKSIPKVEVQIIIDEIPEQTQEFVFNSIERANSGIHKSEFEKNRSACYTPFICPYLANCIKGSNGDELEKV